MAREADIHGILPQVFTVPVGVTVGVFVGEVPGQIDTKILNLTSSATLFLLQANTGTTYTGATLAALFASYGFAMAANSVMTLVGPANFYLAATGATATVHVLAGRSSGF